MKFPWQTRKRRYRGAGKSPAERAKATQGRIDDYLLKIYLGQLKANPNFARELARTRYGREMMDLGQDHGSDLVAEIEKMAKVKDLLRDEFDQDKGHLGETLIRELAPLVPQLLASVRPAPGEQGLPQRSERYVLQEPQPKKTPRSDELPSLPGMSPVAELSPPVTTEPEKVGEGISAQEAAISSLVQWAMSAYPEEVATELFRYKGEADDVRGFCWDQLISNDFETVSQKLRVVPSVPGYEFLGEYIDGVDQAWLALIFDLCQKFSVFGAEIEQSMSLAGLTPANPETSEIP